MWCKQFELSTNQLAPPRVCHDRTECDVRFGLDSGVLWVAGLLSADRSALFLLFGFLGLASLPLVSTGVDSGFFFLGFCNILMCAVIKWHFCQWWCRIKHVHVADTSNQSDLQMRNTSRNSSKLMLSVRYHSE